MCLVIDANVASDFNAPSEDAKPVLQRIQKGNLRIVAGPSLKRELFRTKIRGLYQQWLLAGKVVEFNDTQLAAAAADINGDLLASNDIHVLALARASGSRLLFSRDEPLHSDFKNRKIINPKGKIYTSAKQYRLLDEIKCNCH
ncbi:PIN domain-containing protein [Bradyrhizobium aeschynomenes]|uniref:PIN domain-containing protein n=1 Tax=Bradyrhizobium aeschynomenes TaxID=2734909 RepID=UPI0015543340|nr:PIN domain-containing protein [Bradyrhizobium aeschynomenes]NPV22381.1 PIN domain-containing protein [Bradyrhizobium aeschynomenes]